MLTALVSLGNAPPDGLKPLADFPESLRSLPWHVVNDGVMGGRSEGGIESRNESLLFSGTTNTDGGGFSSIRSARQPFDLMGYEGIRLRSRGDGRSYTFRLTTSGSSPSRFHPSYWARFDTSGDGWQEIDIPFDRFWLQWRGRRIEGPPLDPRRIDGLGLMIYDGEDGPFRLEVDWIAGYRPKPER